MNVHVHVHVVWCIHRYIHHIIHPPILVPINLVLRPNRPVLLGRKRKVRKTNQTNQPTFLRRFIWFSRSIDRYWYYQQASKQAVLYRRKARLIHTYFILSAYLTSSSSLYLPLPVSLLSSSVDPLSPPLFSFIEAKPPNPHRSLTLEWNDRTDWFIDEMFVDWVTDWPIDNLRSISLGFARVIWYVDWMGRRWGGG